jgi:RNA polymerase sigma factor (sigma-70 family)
MHELLAKEPTPEAQVEFLDQLEKLIAEYSSKERRILEMRMNGYSEREIAAELKVTDRTVRRLFERMRGQAAEAGFHP